MPSLPVDRASPIFECGGSFTRIKSKFHYDSECPQRCLACGKVYPRVKSDFHRDSECGKRLVKCDQCEKSVEADNLKKHLVKLVCFSFPCFTRLPSNFVNYSFFCEYDRMKTVSFPFLAQNVEQKCLSSSTLLTLNSTAQK